MINNSLFATLLQQKADTSYDGVGQALTPEEVAAISFAAQRIQDVNIVVVPRVNKLPELRTTGALSDISDGSIYYVEDLQIHTFNVGTKWITLDGKTLRNDSTAVAATAYAWGSNTTNGQLGDNTVVNKSSPVSVVGNIDSWCQVSAGNCHTVGVSRDGTLWAWGRNTCGQLGDGTTVARSSPVSVLGGFTDWCQVSAATCLTLAVRQNGTMWSWGQGFLGGGSTRSTPAQIGAASTQWCAVATSTCGFHSAAIQQNGTLWTWGCNLYGQLGNNTATLCATPVSAVGGFTDWCQVSVGGLHTAAVRQNGTLWAWGNNFGCQLGDGTSTNRSSPVSVIGGFTDWCQVSLGDNFTVALRQNGTLWAWGCGQGGTLGTGNNNNQSSPTAVVGGFTDWCQVSSGPDHTAAVRQNGTLWAWGSNGGGRLGNGTVTNSSSPVSVVGGFTDWYRVSAGYGHTIGLRAN